MPLAGSDPIDYFEVTVLACGEHPDLAIGFSTPEMVTTRHVGHCTYSWGYLSTDGYKYHHSSRYGQPYGSRYSAGDVVGCGIDWLRREIFFTLNGTHLGTAFTSVSVRDKRVYPTVSLHSNGERVRCNFRGPFVFQNQLDQMLQAERQSLRKQIGSTSVSIGDIHSLVEEYLLHEGYSETLQRFTATASEQQSQQLALTVDTSESLRELNNAVSRTSIVNDSSNRSTNPLVLISDRRKALGQLVLDGKIEQALEQLPLLLPDIQTSTKQYGSLLLKLHCQCFIECVRESRIDDAVQYAKDHMYHYSEQTTDTMSDCDVEVNGNDDNMSVDDCAPSRVTTTQTETRQTPLHQREQYRLSEDDEHLLLDTLGLLAYPDPMQSPVSVLMSLEKRRTLWHDVQRAVILHYDIPPASRLEVLMQQLVLLKRTCAAESVMGIASSISDQ